VSVEQPFITLSLFDLSCSKVDGLTIILKIFCSVVQNCLRSFRHKVQPYMIKALCGFPQNTPVSSTNKTYHNDITEILLKVVLNTNNPKSSINVSKHLLNAVGFTDKLLKLSRFPTSNKFGSPHIAKKLQKVTINTTHTQPNPSS